MPERKRTLKPKTPGYNETVEPEKETIDGGPEEEITMTKSALEAMVSQMVESKVLTEVQNSKRAGLAKGGSEAVDLPDQSDVDASKLTRAVLTKQGYVCPVVHPTDKKRLEKATIN